VQVTAPRVDMVAHEETVTASARRRGTDEAESRGDGMPCERYEVLRGTLVAENP
jgi:hypothetical protein